MNYYKLILEGLREWATVAVGNKIAAIHMLIHFIKLMGEEDFNNRFESNFLNEPDFDTAWYDFHKSMRQTDFYDIDGVGGHLDMLFWQFIHLTDLPYFVFKTFREKIKVGVVDEFDNDLEGTKGWDKFGFFYIS